MFDDPETLTSSNWNDIHNWLTLFWIYFPVVITFGFTILVAHAFIPSLIFTGHLSARANKLRLPLTFFALAVLIVAVVLMAFVINLTLSVDNFWDRYLI